ncbi:hypothetical protein EZS27_017698 [termite gut metagenome]|uniref:Uncharacterized protein n=1 Tax=termite gut metagenome TaxID=433724 RepID=A0A5J4RKQ2_9ZZZZ
MRHFSLRNFQITNIGTKGELHEYYQRKVAGGRNKMAVINAVRAKLVYPNVYRDTK